MRASSMAVPKDARLGLRDALDRAHAFEPFGRRTDAARTQLGE
jgi:hypothetical protein